MLTFDSYGGIHLYNGSYTEFFETHKEGVDGSLSWDFTDNDGGASKKAGAGKSGSSDKAGSGAAFGKGGDGNENDSEAKANRGDHKLKFSYKEQKEYETIEDDIAKCEQKIAQYEEDILANATNFGKLREIGEKKEAEEKRLEELMERYVYLEEKAEAIAKQ